MQKTPMHALALATVLLAAAALPHAACQSAAPGSAAAKAAFADLFSAHCHKIGPEACAEFTTNVLKDVTAAASGGGPCVVSPAQVAAFKPLTRSLNAWVAFFKAMMLDKKCIADAACTERAYRAVGSDTKAGSLAIFYQLPACAVTCNPVSLTACTGISCSKAIGFSECSHRKQAAAQASG